MIILKDKRKRIAIFFLILMCVQYAPLEGVEVSYIKFTAMLIAPFIWLNNFSKFSKAFKWASIYMLVIIISVIINIESFRLSTVGYKISFLLMFIMYYDLIYHKHVFTLETFINLLKKLILAYTICLLIQQLAIILGLQSFSILNITKDLDRGIGSNSLTIEPSHAARIMTVLMLCLLRMYEVKWGRKSLKLSRLYKENKWVILGFLWSMLTMGSGTAFVGLGILALYFLKKQYILIVGFLLLFFYLAIPYINNTSFNRAKIAFESTLTLDQAEIKKADYSAASRIVPLINTFTELDLSKTETWVGKGIDTNESSDYLSEEQKIGGISDYGLISYIISLIFVMVCCIRKLLSLETLIFILLLGAGISNIAYIWGILMLFTTSKYFFLKWEKNKRHNLNIKKNINYS